MNQNYFQIFLILLLLFSITACDEPTTDTSSVKMAPQGQKVSNKTLPQQFNHQNIGDLEVRIERGAFHYDYITLQGTRIQYALITFSPLLAHCPSNALQIVHRAFALK